MCRSSISLYPFRSCRWGFPHSNRSVFVQADITSSRDRAEQESVSSVSDRQGHSPKIRAAEQRESMDARGSDMELSQSQFSCCSSPPLLLPPPFRSTIMHGSKASTGADTTTAESDTLTLDGPGARSGCEEEAPGSPVRSHPLHSAPARMPPDSSTPDGLERTEGGSGAADDLCASPPVTVRLLLKTSDLI